MISAVAIPVATTDVTFACSAIAVTQAVTQAATTLEHATITATAVAMLMDDTVAALLESILPTAAGILLLVKIAPPESIR